MHEPALLPDLDDLDFTDRQERNEPQDIEDISLDEVQLSTMADEPMLIPNPD